MFKLFSIKAKIFAMFIIVLFPIAIFQCVNLRQDLNNSIESKLQSNIDLAQAISHSFLQYIEQTWIKEACISTFIMSNPNMSSEEISQYLLEVMENETTIQGLTWISPDGIAIASSKENMLNVSLNQREYVKKIQQGQEKYFSNLVISMSTETPILPIAKGIRKDGKLKGIMSAAIDIEKLGEKFSRLTLNKGDVFEIVDSNGIIIYRSDTPNIYLKELQLSENAPGWGALKGELVKIPKRISEYDGSAKMSVVYPIKEIGWAIHASSRYDVVLKNDYNRLRNSAITLILVLLGSLIIALALGWYITMPIYKLRQVAQTIKNGDFSVRANISGNDEIAITSQVFDSMIDSLEESDLVKTQFFSNISHELKTPINVIFATSQLLENTTKTKDIIIYEKKVKNHMQVIRQNCYRLIRLVNNLIDITRLDNGFLKPNFININIVALIEDITMSIVKYGQAKGITILFDTEIEEKMIACDPDMIERIILNLISNAIKFTDFGGNISVNLYDKGNRVLILVKDNGIGIPKDKLELIFERFKQVESSLNRNHEGSGIGLSLVKALVEAHNGKIAIFSEMGEGTEVVIDLPAIPLPEDECSYNKKNNAEKNPIERASIEFSDIYFDYKKFD